MTLLTREETIALQVLLAKKIEQTCDSDYIFEEYLERNIYERILLKLCPPANFNNVQIEERLMSLNIK